MFFNSSLKLWLSCLVVVASGFELNGRGRPNVARTHAASNISTTNTRTSRHAATKVSTSMKITAPASLASSTCTPHSTVTYESSWSQIIPQNNCTTIKGRHCVVHWTECHVYFGSVDMTYWPTSSKNGTRYPSTIVRPDLQLTMTSPSVYIVVKTVYATNPCGQVGPTYKQGVVSIHPTNLKTVVPYPTTHATASRATVAMDFNDLANCPKNMPTPVGWNIGRPTAGAYARCHPDLDWDLTYKHQLGGGYWGGDCARTGPAGHGLFDPPSAVQPCSNDDCLLGDGSGTTVETATPTSVDTGSTTSSLIGVDPSSTDVSIINNPNLNPPEPVTTTANSAATATAATDSAPAVDPTTLIPASPTAIIPSNPVASSDPISGTGSTPALDPGATDPTSPTTVPIVVAATSTIPAVTDGSTGATDPILSSGISGPSSAISTQVAVITGGGQTYTRNSASAYVFSSSTLTPGGTVVVSGSSQTMTYVLPTSATAVVINDVTHAISTATYAVTDGSTGVKSVSDTQVAVITGGGQTYTRNSASAYVIGSSTLTPGGTVVVSGSSQTMTYVLPTSATAVIVNDVTHAISTATYAVADGSTGVKSVSDTQVAVITGGGQTYTRNSASAYVIGSSTLTPGGTVVVSGASQTMTYVLPTSATAVIVNDVTQAISTTSHAITSPAAKVVIGSTTYTADAASAYIVDGMRISPGSTVTVSGTNGPTTLGVESTGGAIVINSITYAASTQSVVDTAMTMTGSSPARTSAGSLKGAITTTIATSSSRAQTVVKDGSSVISFTAGLDQIPSSTGTFTTPRNSQASGATAVATSVSAKSASVNFGSIWVVTSLWICGLVLLFVL
ncbi:hypothetical protein BP6252_13223 [Coleophoma cylindrospora]|uniref:Uncharacterized protein n=1 Tax=Coleophoma cylindrospora TaxID=1849047 RepID=A0A3D8QAN9_9HELO|nr:hypothetical protein BP6252_13223 [Coleophoma cylindrospora]